MLLLLLLLLLLLACEVHLVAASSEWHRLIAELGASSSSFDRRVALRSGKVAFSVDRSYMRCMPSD